MQLAFKHKLYVNGMKDIGKEWNLSETTEEFVTRANYQAAVWKRATEASPNTPSPHGH